MKIKVTLYDKSCKYFPVSAFVKIDSLDEFYNDKDRIKTEGIKKIMQQRGWTRRELITYNFLTCRMKICPE